jgi:membrane fusion protein, multidrug efflux system
MRAIFSYGAAGVIVLLFAVWLATGTYVAGGHGPGQGERPIIAIFEENGGPITTALTDAGLIAEHHVEEGGIDPHLTIAERVAQAGGTEAAARSVRTQTFTIQPMAIEAPLRGRTQAKTIVQVLPETAGKITEIHVTKGQRVEGGDPLCTIDRGVRSGGVEQAQAALAQAQAGLQQAQQQYDTNAELRTEGLAPANSAAQFEAQLRAAQAAVASAPLATVGSMAGPQTPCATIVQLDPMLFVGAIPEVRIALARTGLTAMVTTITNQVVEGKVTYIAATADPATRSFPVEIELPNPDGSIRDGLTATALVNLGTAPAHLLPQSVLTLDDEGVLGVRAVENDVVAFYPVTIVRDTREGVWVTGLPNRVDVITVGQEYVTAGQRVNATNVTAEASAESTEGVPS